MSKPPLVRAEIARMVVHERITVAQAIDRVRRAQEREDHAMATPTPEPEPPDPEDRDEDADDLDWIDEDHGAVPIGALGTVYAKREGISFVEAVTQLHRHMPPGRRPK